MGGEDMRIVKFAAILLCAAMLSSCIVINYPPTGVVDIKTADQETTDTPTESATDEPCTKAAEPITIVRETEIEITSSPEETAETTDDTEAQTEAQTEAAEAEPYIKSIFLISLTSPIFRNQTATVDIIGKPNTTYVIEVFYATGKSNAKGLEAKTSDDIGAVSWSWRIGPSLKTGRYKIVISGGGDTLETEIQVN